MTYLLAALAVLALLVLAAVRYAIVFPRQPHSGPLPKLTVEEQALAVTLAAHLEAVAGRPHNINHFPALEDAARYIERTLAQYGYASGAQSFTVGATEVRNIEVIIEPDGANAATPTYVVGAHYDSHYDSPGANDNGTGVAALLEITRALADLTPSIHRLRLVFFVNEEHPYGKTPDMGSWQYAKALKDRGENILGMMALETLGYFTDQPGTQKFPPPFGLIYPDTGNFVAFVALPGARRLVHKAIAAFRNNMRFPSIGGVAPGFLPGIDLSDHWAFNQFGFPALMITDTAPFRNPYYHRIDDLPHTVDTESLARITVGLEAMLRDMID